jgi:uncharacterized protein (DUF2236 family)
VGLNREPPEICLDPERAYLPVDAVARVVHGDLHAMLIGGIGSLLFEMLHPHAMAGVAQHSRYREDALGRLLQTANFIGATTYGSRDTARAAIDRVLMIHRYVHGVADDGVAYDANDPHLLSWIHVAGTSMFLTSYQRHGALELSPAQADAYVKGAGQVARDVGVLDPPATVSELGAQLETFRPELRLSTDGALARDFIRRGVVEGVRQRLAYRLLVDSALELMQPWARELLGVDAPSPAQRLVERPATAVLGAYIRAVVPPVAPVTSPA